MSVEARTDLTAARRVLQAADTDIAAFFDFFTDETRFRMGGIKKSPTYTQLTVRTRIRTFLPSGTGSSFRIRYCD